MLCYYLSVVLPHAQVGEFLASIFLPGSRVRYNGIMLAVFVVIMFGVGIWLYQKIQPDDRKLLVGYTTVTIVLVAVCINILFVLNVEAIHFIQYAIFAIICFQITHSYFRTMFWSTIAGFIDELYQYIYLATEWTEYYDFNDVLIDGVGAGIGLIIIRAVVEESQHIKWKTLFALPEMYFTLALLVLGLISFASGFLSIGPDSSASFCFMQVEQVGFWKEQRKLDVKWHVVKPIEGLVFMVLILGFYSGLQKGSVDISKLSSNN